MPEGIWEYWLWASLSDSAASRARIMADSSIGAPYESNFMKSVVEPASTVQRKGFGGR